MAQYASRQESLLKRLDQTAHLTGFDSLYGHLRFVQALRSACGFRPEWVAYEPLAWPKVAVDALRRKVDGAVRVRWARNERSCLIPFGPMLAKHPHLEVKAGQVRKLPFRVEEGRLVLDLQAWELDESEPQKQMQAARARWARLSMAEKQELVARARERQRRRFIESVAKALKVKK